MPPVCPRKLARLRRTLAHAPGKVVNHIGAVAQIPYSVKILRVFIIFEGLTIFGPSVSVSGKIICWRHQFFGGRAVQPFKKSTSPGINHDENEPFSFGSGNGFRGLNGSWHSFHSNA